MVCGYFGEEIPCELLGMCTLVHVNKNSISVDQARYATYIVVKYFYTATVKLSNKFYKTTLPSYMIFTKEDFFTSDEQVERLTREYNT